MDSSTYEKYVAICDTRRTAVLTPIEKPAQRCNQENKPRETRPCGTSPAACFLFGYALLRPLYPSPLPCTLQPAAKASGRDEMKLVSWNVNGLRACVKKGFYDVLKRWTPTCSACRRPSSRRAKSLSIWERSMASTGITPLEGLFRHGGMDANQAAIRPVWPGGTRPRGGGESHAGVRGLVSD